MSIKKSPEDFQVEEVLSAEVSKRTGQEPAAFALYRLTKESLATPEAAAQIARQLQVPAGAIAYAGLKDKHARTIQHVTLKRTSPQAEAPVEAAGRGWTMERLGYLDAPITAEAIAANRFRIVVRNLDSEACAETDQAAALLTAQPVSTGLEARAPSHEGQTAPNPPTPFPKREGVVAPAKDRAAALLVVNYFGDQRFGSARHGQGFLARKLIHGEFEEALKLAIATAARKDRREDKERRRAIASTWGQWPELLRRLGSRRYPERGALEALARNAKDFRGAFTALPYLLQQLSVYAYQSYLWNETARRLVFAHCGERGTVIEADDPFGAMAFPESAAVPADLRTLDLPLLGYKTELKEPWREAAETVLAAEQITTAQLRIPGVRRPFFGEVPRKLFVEAAAFSLSSPEKDETAFSKRFKRLLTFELPRGAYATVVLRALGQ